jgi:hypothetical protein
MQGTKRGIRHAGLGTIAAALVTMGLGAVAATQTIDAGGLTFEVPGAWKSSPPTSTMRRAELKVAPVEGDKDPAELVVFAFPGGAGSVQDNIKRWQNQFKDANGDPPPVESKEIKGKNVGVTRVEIAGHYFPMTFPNQPKQADRPNYRLLGAIVQTGATGYFLRMTGPDKTMKAVGPEFDQMIASMSADKP